MSSVFKKIDDFVERNIPKKNRSFWKLAGPGALLVGLSIEAEESIIWPRIVAELGSGMIWQQLREFSHFLQGNLS